MTEKRVRIELIDKTVNVVVTETVWQQPTDRGFIDTIVYRACVLGSNLQTGSRTPRGAISNILRVIALRERASVDVDNPRLS